MVRFILYSMGRLLLVLVFLNLVLLDFWLYSYFFPQNTFLNVSRDNSTSADPDYEKNLVEEDTCGAECEALIDEKVKKATANLTVNADSTTIIEDSTSVKEHFVTIGSGSNATDDWTDVPGAQAYIDSESYGSIKTVIFEALLRIPTGNQTAYARLFNVTDKHPVWFSEVSLDGGTPELVSSQPINLDSGNKLYRVQMKTSLKYPALLDMARLHITTH